MGQNTAPGPAATALPEGEPLTPSPESHERAAWRGEPVATVQEEILVSLEQRIERIENAIQQLTNHAGGVAQKVESNGIAGLLGDLFGG